MTTLTTEHTVFTKTINDVEVKGHLHPNGGGFVAETAYVDEAAYVGSDAMVLDYANVLDGAPVRDKAVVCDNATLCGNASACGNDHIGGDAMNYESEADRLDYREFS